MASFGQVEYLIFGVLMTIAVYFGRIFVGKITLTKRFSHLDRAVTNSMIPRGLAAAVLATYPITMGLPNAEAYPQLIFFIILSSVVITTIGLGKSKKIPPPESIEGGFVKPSDDSKENLVKEVEETSDLLVDDKIEGGFVKKESDNSLKK
jgi:cell volume regulation protein A